MALHLLLCLILFHSSIHAQNDDTVSLLTFKSALTDPTRILLNWSPNSDPCSWYGVACDSDSDSGKIISLNLSSLFIHGNLHPSISNLTSLKTLSIPHNQFSGSIPVELGRMTSLEILELQGNNFSGNIPPELTHLTSLVLLNLSYNGFSGPMPSGIIGMNGGMNVLDLSNNLLSGSVDEFVFGNCYNLHHLKLSNNVFVDEIPLEIGNCLNLRTLLLDGNIFQGRIPKQIGGLGQLVILDVSRNSLTGRIPEELGNCLKLSVVVLTNLVDFGSTQEIDEDGNVSETYRGEFNAFDGDIPHEILLLPNLEMIWAPRANLRGRLPGNWTKRCSIRVLNLGQNYLTGEVPASLSSCKNLSFFDLNSNGLKGNLSSTLKVPCMSYFNVSRNSLSGFLPEFDRNCDRISSISFRDEYIQSAYRNVLVSGSQMTPLLGYDADESRVEHDFSWNQFYGTLPSFPLGDELLFHDGESSYILSLNNNMFSGSIPIMLSPNCSNLRSFSVNLSMNRIQGRIHQDFIRNCSRLTNFEAQENLISGSISNSIGRLKILKRLDLRRNWLFGALPAQIGDLTGIKWILLGQNNLTGSIPVELGKLKSLLTLDLSRNVLTGSIPETLSNVKSLEILLLNHNNLSGEIPRSISSLANLSLVDFSFNSLLVQDQAPPTNLPVPLQVPKRKGSKKSFIIAVATSASASALLSIIIIIIVLGKKIGICRQSTITNKEVVTFVDDIPVDLNYDNVVRATGNFSIRNLIGTGGFGSTYKAEIAPGFLVAVKRLSIGRFQGIKQFDAEIRTLGRIRQKNLVTLIGYHVGESEMFLIYNYLCGGNLETFIHEKNGRNVEWAAIHKIALDIANALSFLHYSCVPRIVHRDIKPSNILLDEDCNAYLSDFGLARLLEVSETHATTDVAGTFGYVAPEYATTCRVSDKADVYSFGVVLLELMSRKKSLDPSFSEYGNGFNIVAWAKLLIEERRWSEIFSAELWASGPTENMVKMLRLASACTVETLTVRPTMRQVLLKLKQLQL